MSREVITLQIGHYSNYIGAHFWNIQESSFVYDPSQLKGPKEICHDVLFREGINPRKEVTFTPRLIAFDLKGSLKTLKQEGSLYEREHEEDEVLWPGDVTMHREVPAVKNRFLRELETEGEVDQLTEYNNDVVDKEIEDDKEAESSKKKKMDATVPPSLEADKASAKDLTRSVETWSDFLGTHFHPKSLHIVEEYHHKDELRPFDLFNCAEEVLSNYDATCEWEDRIRRFAEECDLLQGFQVMADTHDGFGGLSAGVLKHIEEEYPGKGILTFGLTPSNLPDDTAQARASRIINSALMYDSACIHSSLFVPMSLASSLWRSMGAPRTFPNLSYDQVPYHTSAILASAIETASVPYRLDTGACHIRDITHTLNAQGRKLGTINAGIPLGLTKQDSLVDYLSVLDKQLPWVSLSPHYDNDKLPIMQSVVLRGIMDKQAKSLKDPRKLPDHLAGCQTVTETLDKYLDDRFPCCLSAKTCLVSNQMTSSPYPQLFSEHLSQNGLIIPKQRLSNQTVDEIPIMTSLQCTPEMGLVIDQLYVAAAKMNIKKHHRYLELGLEEDDYIEVLDNLKSLSSNYKLETEGL